MFEKNGNKNYISFKIVLIINCETQIKVTRFLSSKFGIADRGGGLNNLFRINITYYYCINNFVGRNFYKLGMLRKIRNGWSSKCEGSCDVTIESTNLLRLCIRQE